MLGILITLLVTQSIILGFQYLSEKLCFKRHVENKLGRKIKIRDIK